MPETMYFLVNGEPLERQNVQIVPPTLNALEQKILTFLRKSPKATSYDVLAHMQPGFLKGDAAIRSKAWSQVNSLLSSMLARNIIELSLDEVNLAHWSIDPAFVDRGQRRGSQVPVRGH